MTPTPNHRMPAEWEPHEATWIGWPTREEDWPGKLEPAQWAFVEIIRHLAPFERIHLIANDDEAKADAEDKLERAGVDLSRIDFHLLPTNRNWLRDSGAIFVRDGATQNLKAVQFQFNAWAKYDNYHLDRAIPQLMAETSGVPIEKGLIRDDSEGERRSEWMIMEGGAVDVNGNGLVMVTEECLLDTVQERNPGFGKSAIEAGLKNNLGCNHVIWLPGGIKGDDTHGHIDDTARFVGERKVLAAVEKDPEHPNYKILRENLVILKNFRDEKGALEVIELPMPQTLEFEGEALPASYANFYIANQTVLVPTFNDPNDRVALQILHECFPDRIIRGIHCVDLVWGLGTIHCLTQQQPARRM